MVLKMEVKEVQESLSFVQVAVLVLIGAIMAGALGVGFAILVDWMG